MQNDLPIVNANELTEREQEILKLIATGTSNKDIAQRLFISSNTVKVHLRNIFAKIGATSRTEAAMYAVQVGLVPSPAAAEPEYSPSSQTESTPGPSSTTSVTVPAGPRPIIRLMSLIAVPLVLVLAVGLGFLLTRPKSAPASQTSLPVPTAESRWHTLTSLPVARSGIGVTVYENQIYVIGGESIEGVSGLVERYNPATDSWTELTRKPVPVTDVNAAVIGGKIFVPGGRTSSNGVTDLLEIYNPRQDKWEEGKTLPLAISAYAMAAFEGRLYLFGGWDGKKYLDSVLIYDPGQDKWSSSVAMPQALGFASAAVAGEKIYVIGGYDGTKGLGLNEVYTPQFEGFSSTWRPAPELPEGRYGIGIASLADSIYIIGGKSGSGSFLSFRSQTNQWQVIESPPQAIGEGARLAQLGEYLFIVGGRINNIPSGQNLSYQAVYTVQIPLIINK